MDLQERYYMFEAHYSHCIQLVLVVMAPGKSKRSPRLAVVEERRNAAVTRSAATALMAEQTLAAPTLQVPPPSIEETLPTRSGGVSASPGAAGTAPDPSKPLSVRCRKTKQPELVDMETGEKPLPNKRGVFLGTRTQYMIRLNGGNKIRPVYAARHSGPDSKDVQGLMARDIGAIIRNDVKMIAPRFFELEKEDRAIVGNKVKLSYDIPETEADMWIFVDTTAARIYKDWKYDCHQHYLHVSKETPEDFVHRPEQWEWLKTHFEDPEFKAVSARNSANRNKGKEKAINHHSGTTPISYRVEEFEKSGHLAPHLSAFVHSYEKCKNAEQMVGNVKRKMDAVLAPLTQPSSDGASTVSQPLTLQAELQILTTEVGERHGTKIRGLGAAVTRPPKVRGGARTSKKKDEETAMLKKQNIAMQARLDHLERIVAGLTATQESGGIEPLVRPDQSSRGSHHTELAAEEEEEEEEVEM